MKRVTIATMLSLALLTFSGCTADTVEDPGRGNPDTSESSNSSAPAPELPSWSPLGAASSAASIPDGISDELDLKSVATAAGSGRDRAGAEQFALDAVAVLQDARIEAKPERVLDSLSSNTMPSDLRRFLILDMESQRSLGSERHLNGALEQWIRSNASGNSDEPDLVKVEIAANLVSEPLDFHTWYRFRADVIWQDGRWRLVAFNASDLGPYTSTTMTTAEQEQYLEGDHWRRVPPRR